MCKAPVQASASPRLLLASVESFSADEKGRLPSRMSYFTTGIFIIAFLIMVELSLRQLFASMQHLHPILEDETSRQILARHIGVDSFSCFVVFTLGWRCRHIMWDMFDATVNRKKGALPMAFENRLFQHQPEACRICVFFLAYQVKNTFDTIVWNDGIEFVVHHVLTLATGWGSLIPGTAHYYAVFYFGISEISTAVLCLLANFDDKHGVKGLADAFPMAKVAIGGIFAVCFIVCRAIMWSTVSYYYCRDAWYALKSNDARLEGRKTWLRFTFCSLSILSLLQIIWLAEIFRVGKEELAKVGLI